MNIRNWFRKPVVLDIYTDRSDLYEHFKVSKMKSFVPSWFKDINPKYEINENLESDINIRGCTGFLDLFSKGFGIPLWSDMRVKVGPIGEQYYQWQFADKETDADIHPQWQRGEFMPDSKYCHIKILTPWVARCSENVDFLMIGNSWVQDNTDDVLIPQGVLNFKHQHALNINMMVRRGEQEKLIEMSCGNPIVQLIPLTDRKVDIKLHLVSTEELTNVSRSPVRSYFDRGHLKTVSKERKCPFH